MINADNIPKALKDRNQWVLWRTIQRDRPTKVPFSVDGTPAKTNDAATWAPFADVLSVHRKGGYDGIGYVFSDADPFCGIDLDGCREPSSGEIAPWAVSIIKELATYAEISPSQTGVKLFAIGNLPFRSGRKQQLPGQPEVCGKAPAVEVYDHGRYFAVTGLRLDDNRPEPEDRAPHVKALCDRYWPQMQGGVSSEFYAPQSVVDRARSYLAKCPPAISGQGGHNTTYRTACILVQGFMLQREQALMLLKEYNQTCVPPWTDRDLEHKIEGAEKAEGPRGYLRHARPDKWASIAVPDYEQPAHRELVCIHDAAQGYIDRMRDGGGSLVRTGLPHLDDAIGGGVEPGEMIILASRPGHGKSAVALQCAHNWTAAGIPVLFVTEEMSASLLGKRLLQFASDIPHEDWSENSTDLEIHLHEFSAERAKCYVVANCGTAGAAVAEIERAVNEHGVKCAIVDYAQLLSSPGRDRYQQMTNTSIALRQVASECGIVLLVICQLNREIENRILFEPKLSDLRDSGQFEQDADVVIFPVWPYQIDQSQDPSEFKMYIRKNRNRETVSPLVRCQFDPARQMIIERSDARQELIY